MATSSTSIAALKTYLGLRFDQFESSSCLLLCDLMNGLSNRITKQSNITTRHLMDIMDRVHVLETGHDKNQNVPRVQPGFPSGQSRGPVVYRHPPGLDSRVRNHTRRSA